MVKTLTHWKKLHNPDYLGSYAFQPGEEMIATIKSVGIEIVMDPNGKQGECTVARFTEKGIKPMILNSTNSKIITKMYGTPYIENWTGRRIQIYVDKVRAFGEIVDGLRIRPIEPKVKDTKLESLNPDHEKWDGAIKSLAEGSIDIEGIRKYFDLDSANEKKLLTAVDNAKA